jgi:hypothetical protein
MCIECTQGACLGVHIYLFIYAFARITDSSIGI